jgi:hypothetical protein
MTQKQLKKMMNHIVKIENSINGILLLFVLSFCDCKQNKTVPTKLNIDSVIVEKNDRIISLFDSLSYSFERGNRQNIEIYWDLVIKNKDSALNYLETFRGKKNNSQWYWIDLKSSRFVVRHYSTVSEEVAALFLTCAIYYNDISFAHSRILYDNAVLNLNAKSAADAINNYRKAKESVNIDTLWNLVDAWKKNHCVGRPFGNSNVFWVCENGGKITRENVDEVVVIK